MRYKWEWVLGTSGVFVMCLLVVHSAVTGLITAVNTDQLANVLVGYVACLVVGSLATLGLTKFGINIRGQAVGESKPLPPHKLFLTPASRPTTVSNNLAIPVAAEISDAPRTILIDGIATFLDNRHPKAATVVEWTDYDPKTKQSVYKSVDLQTLRRFARLHTPSRSEWSGKATTYSLCLSFFRYNQWVQTAGQGVEWVDHYKRLHRRLAYLGDTQAISELWQPPTQSLAA